MRTRRFRAAVAAAVAVGAALVAGPAQAVPAGPAAGRSMWDGAATIQSTSDGAAPAGAGGQAGGAAAARGPGTAARWGAPGAVSPAAAPGLAAPGAAAPGAGAAGGPAVRATATGRVVHTPAVGAAGAKRRLDAAARLAAGLEAASPATRGRVAPLRRDRQGRAVVYVAGDSRDAVRQAVAAAGGVVSAGGGALVRAAVPAARLVGLAGHAGVREVRRPDPAVPMSTTSEGAQLSGALDWQASGRSGAGVKVGIIDVGFERLDAAQANGELPATVTLDNGSCDPERGVSHGTTMAEIVHDMAPAADLFLACVTDTLGFDAAARWLQQQGAQVVNVSLGFPGAGRGDGVADPAGADRSPAAVVAWLRGQGILVVAAAGNEADKHWAATAADPEGNGWLNISDASEAESFSVAAGAEVTLELTWDAWPVTSADLDLYVMDTAAKPTGLNDPHLHGRYSIRNQQTTPGGLSPTEQVTFTETSTTGGVYWAYVQIKGQLAPVRYDLTGYGAASGFAYVSAAGSIAEPASSPYALAVGGITPDAAAASGPVTGYSSRGPTIDGRVKPDVTGFTEVSSYTGGVRPGRTLAGTSAAAAHVAGAAALYMSANPGLDPAELESLLLDSSTRPRRDSDFGYGVLGLGSPRAPQPPTGSAFTPLAATRRVLSTYDSTGGHPGALTAGETFTLAIPNLPADTTAVVLNLTGVASEPTHVDVFADIPTGATTLALHPAHPGSVLAVATLDPRDKVVRLRNAAGSTQVIADLLGYFSTSSSASAWFPNQRPVRLPMPAATLAAGPANARTVPVRGVGGVPGNATAVLVSVTASEATLATHIQLYAQTWPDVWAFSPYPGTSMTYTYLVPIAADGAIRIGSDAGSVKATVDVLGWFAAGTGARYVPLHYTAPALNTATGTGTAHSPFGAGEARAVRVTAGPRIPYDASGAVLSVSAPRTELRDQLALWPEEYGWSGAPSLGTEMYVPGAGAPPAAPAANTVVTPLGPGGVVRLRSYAGSADAVVDIAGYFVGGSAVAPGAGANPVGRWKFDEGTGTAVADSAGSHPATMRGGTGWAAGVNGQAAWLDGTSGYAATAGPVLNTAASYSVSAWVQLARKGSWFTAVGQDGAVNSAFVLQYSNSLDRWVFDVLATDTAGPAERWAAGTRSPKLGEWTHLVGVYDAAAHEARLYVNGTLDGVTGGITAFPANGPLSIGRNKYNGAIGQYFPRGIDDVQAYASALTDSAVRDLYAGYGSLPRGQAPGASVDGDNRADLISINLAGDALLQARPNNGAFPASAWDAPVTIGGGWTDPGAVRIADLNGDGRTETIEVNFRGDSNIYVWPNIGGFPGQTYGDRLPISFGSGWTDASKVQFADLNGDGRADLIGVNARGDGVILAWLNTGAYPAWPWAEPVEIGYGWTSPSQAKFADLNGDGRAELIGVNVRNDGVILAWPNNTAFPAWPWGEPVAIGSGWTNPNLAKFGDLTGDGRAELVAVNARGGGEILGWLNTGGYPTWPWSDPVVQQPSGWPDPTRVAVG